MVYLTDLTLKKRQFLVIITDKVDPDHQLSGTISHEKILQHKMPQSTQTKGKIILFEGQSPIIIDDPDNYIIFFKGWKIILFI